MMMSKVFCPGGKTSQTGVALLERYRDIGIVNCGGIDDVEDKIQKSTDHYGVPIWNSHQGEIEKASYVWDLIAESQVKLLDIWAKKIDFWLIRPANANTPLNVVGSVVVAKTQCADFLQNNKIKLVERSLTTVAYDEYINGAQWDGVLVAPMQDDIDSGFEVTQKDTANANNFTSFVRLAKAAIAPDHHSGAYIFGVSMSPLKNTLKDAEQSFFINLLESAKDIDSMPRLIFVFNRPASVGLLFEGGRITAGDLLDSEELDKGDVSIYEDAGFIDQSYAKQLQELFAKNFTDLSQSNFILHKGENTCLFACPPLGIYTHGYEASAVEPVFRFYMARLFDLISKGFKCTSEQFNFFNYWKSEWEMDKGNFIKFIEI